MKLFSFIFFFLIGFSGFSQSPVFRSYTNSNGLPSSETFYVLQDSKGFIWIATNSGVSRFNGYTFQNFDLKNGLPDNTVFNFYEDYKGRIWFLPLSNKFSYFENDTIKLYKYNDSIQNAIKGTFLLIKNSFKIDSADNVTFGIKDKGCYKFNSSGKSSRTFDRNDYNTQFIKSDSKGVQFISVNSQSQKLTHIKNNKKYELKGFQRRTMGDIHYSLRKKNGHIIVSVYDEIIEISDTSDYKEFQAPGRIIWMHCTKEGDVWLGTYKNGAFLYKNGDFDKPPANHILPDLSVSSILNDNEGGIWFSTLEEGVFYTAGLHITTYTMADGLSANRVLCLGTDCNGKLLAGFNKPYINQFNENFIKIIEIGKSKSVNVSGFLNIDDNVYVASNSIGAFVPKKLLEGNMKYYDISGLKGIILASLSLAPGENGAIWSGGSYSLTKIFNNKQIYDSHDESINLRCLSLEKNPDKSLWIGTPNGLFKYQNNSYVDYGKKYPFLKIRINKIKHLGEKIIVLGTKGYGLIFWNEEQNKTLTITTAEGITNNSITSVFINNNTVWAGTETGLNKISFSDINKFKYSLEKFTAENGLPANEVNDVIVLDSIVFLATNIGISKFNHLKYIKASHSIPTYITGISINQELQSIKPSYNLDYDQNNIQIKFVGLGYKNAGKLTYKYKLSGLNDVSMTTQNTQIIYPFLPNGEYFFSIAVLNDDGTESTIKAEIKFIINPPFWKTKWFFALIIILLISSIYIYIKSRERRLIHEKNILEEKVKERTIEVVMQKEEIQQQKEEIEAQRDELSFQKAIVDQKNKDITSSITYACQIQEAVLPSEQHILNILGLIKNSSPSYFIIYKPKDIVSGDFYFVERRKNMIFLSVADCTGHGVPGGFMSMLGISFLFEIIAKEEVQTASQVLDELRQYIIQSLQQKGLDDKLTSNIQNGSISLKDGMDISFVALNTDTLEMQYAGANNSLYIVKNINNPIHQPINPSTHQLVESLTEPASNKLVEVKPDKMPIGIYEDMKPFTNNVIQLKSGDSLYLLSDGFEDQFGGPKGKKFLSKKLKDLLSSISIKPMPEQKNILENSLEIWKKQPGVKYEQTDDITVLGIKI